MTTTRAEPGRESAGVTSRPISARTPKTSKNAGETRAPVRTRAEPAPVSEAESNVMAPSAANARLRICRSA
jgi:hypothetical protein